MRLAGGMAIASGVDVFAGHGGRLLGSSALDSV